MPLVGLKKKVTKKVKKYKKIKSNKKAKKTSLSCFSIKELKVNTIENNARVPVFAYPIPKEHNKKKRIPKLYQ